MNENPSPEFALGQIVFLKADPSTRGAVVAVLPGTPENRINVFADGKIQTFYPSQLQVSVSSDILTRIISAPPETIERIESLLQSPSEFMPIVSPTSQAVSSPVNPGSSPDRPEKQQPESIVETAVPSEKQQKPQAEKSQQSKKKSSHWDADRLLSQFFAQPVRFITYTGIKDLSQVEAKRYLLKGLDANGEEIKMAKLQVLFAFPKEKMPDLKPYVKVRTPLKAQNLQLIEDQNERFHVDDELLMQAKDNKSTVSVATRAGYVLNGWIQHFDEYVIYMRVGEKVVVVYRHGLFEFTVEDQ